MKNTENQNTDDTLAASPKRKKGFLIFYILFALTLAALALAALSHVSSVLEEYEAAQPDTIAVECAEKIRQAALKNRLDEVLSFSNVRKEMNISDEEYRQFQQEIAGCDKLTVKKASNDGDEEGVLCYNILLNDTFTVAQYKIKSIEQKTKLAIFTVDTWTEKSLEATMFSEEFTLPSSVSVSMNGKKAEGVLSEDEKTVSYKLCSIIKPDIVISDILGNSVSYTNEGEYSFKEYKLTLPSNFTVTGKEIIPPTSEETEPIDEFTNLYAYFSDTPVMCSYDLFVMENRDYSLTVLDNYGQEVDISEMGDVITITEQTRKDTLPQNIENPPNPLEIAKQWNLFMTKDLAGERYGFYTMAKYLFKDSTQYNRAWEWVTGDDISYTSVHTLGNPPFTKEEVKNFVSYGDRCFSCEIYLEKTLYLTVTGGVATDTMHSIFYFGYLDDTDNGIDDPHWGIIDTASIFE